MGIVEQLEADEGRRRHVYQDSLGYWTIAVGICVDSRVKGAGLLDREIEALTDMRLESVGEELERAMPWLYHMLDDALRKGGEDEIRARARHDAIVGMAWQMGVPKLLGFRKMLWAFRRGDFEAAAREALDSRWARQTPARALRTAEQIRSGVRR